MIYYLKLDDIFDNGKYQGRTVREVLEENRKNLVTLSKQGYFFSDEACEFARYKRTIRDEKIICEFIDRSKQPKEKIKCPKDSLEKARKFLRELSTLDNEKYIEDKNIEVEEDIETSYIGNEE